MPTKPKNCAVLVVVIVIMGMVITASSIAAPPEFKYNARGKTFRLRAAVNATVLEAVGGGQVTCTGFEGTGEFEGNSPTKKVTKLLIEFVGCRGFNVNCTSATKPAGQIALSEMTGELGYIKKPPLAKVGLLLKASAPGEIAEFECGALGKSKVKGSVIGELIPLNQVIGVCRFFNLSFRQMAGKQIPVEFEGTMPTVLKASLNAGAFEEAGLEAFGILEGIELGREVEIEA